MRGFGRPKWRSKSVLARFFSDVFFRLHVGIVFGSFLGASDLENSVKTIGFSMVFANFYKIDAFKKVAKQIVDFCFAFGGSRR